MTDEKARAVEVVENHLHATVKAELAYEQALTDWQIKQDSDNHWGYNPKPYQPDYIRRVLWSDGFEVRILKLGEAGIYVTRVWPKGKVLFRQGEWTRTKLLNQLELTFKDDPWKGMQFSPCMVWWKVMR